MKKRILFLLTIALVVPITFMALPIDNKAKVNRNRIAAQTPKKIESIDQLSLKITVRQKELTATFVDSETTRDFIKLLPLTLRMDDLSQREKYSGISQALSKKGAVKTTFLKGDIAYWLGGGIAAFYNQDNHEVKAGLIVLARLEKGIEFFAGPGSVDVKFEAVKEP